MSPPSRTTAAGRASAAGCSVEGRREFRAAGHAAERHRRALPINKTIARSTRGKCIAEELAGSDQAEQARDRLGSRQEQGGDARRRAAGAGLRHDARQRAAARAAIVAAGCGHHHRAHRRRSARVLLDPRRARGRDQHRPQHQGNCAARSFRGRQAHGAEERGPRAGQGVRHRGELGGGDPQSRARDLHAGPGRLHPHGVHCHHGQGLRSRGAQQARRRADRPHPGRQPL